jgi:hypothetical protein
MNALRAEDFDLGSHGKVSLKAPEGWTITGKAVTPPGKGEMGYALKVDAPEGVNAKGLITFLYVPEQKPSKEGAEDFLRKNGEQFLKSSVEKTITPVAFDLKQGFGCYSVFTDASLVGKPVQAGNCKVMGSGIVQLKGTVLVVVTLLADDAQGKEFRSLVELINGLTVK